MMTNLKELRVRVTRTQYERVKTTAESKGKSISQYLRTLIFEYDMNVTYKILEINNIIREVNKDTVFIRENLEKLCGKGWIKN